MATQFIQPINRAVSVIRYAAIAAVLFLICIPAKAQTRDSVIVQSPYYDAIVLYYAINNHKVYPMLMSAEEIAAANEASAANTTSADIPMVEGAAGNPLFGKTGNTTKKYKIIESSTGKVIIDNLPEDKIDSVLNSAENIFSDDEKKSFIFEILGRNANTNDFTEKNIRELYKDNIYLNEEKDTSLAFLFNKSKFSGKNSFSEIKPFNPNGGAGPTSTQVFEGITEFLIEAVNKEINDAFFIHLKEALSKFDELKILFPKTLKSLDKIEVTNYTSSLNAMKLAFREDIKSILSNVSKLTTLKRYQILVNRYPALTLVFTACDLISLLKNGTIPAEILYQINNAPYITQCDPNNYSSTIKLAALLSNSLRGIKINDENKNTIGWINRANLITLRDDKFLFQIFMGLFAQHAKGIIFTISANNIFDLQKTLFEKEVKEKVLNGQFIIYNFSKTQKNIEDDILAAKGLERGSAGKSDYIKIYLRIADEIIGLSENCLDILPSEKATEARKIVKLMKGKYLPLLQQANTVLSGIEEKEYTMALYEADTLLHQVFAGTDIDSLKNVLAIAEKNLKNIEGDKEKTETAKYLRQSIGELDTLIKSKKTFEEIRNYYIKYGLFISSVAEAKSSADVKEAIKAFALPTGSSRIKKEHHFSIGLNSFVGVYHAWNKQYRNLKLPAREFGITAPIGLAVNFGHFLGKSSFSVYAGIIDVGAIFTYKVSSDSAIKSDIQFSQLFSPSVGFVYGLPIIKNYNIPLSFGVNYQWGPKLKKVDDTGNSLLPLLAQRVNVFIAVDLPIVNFHVSKK